MDLDKKKLIYFFCCGAFLACFLTFSVFLIYKSSMSENKIYENKAQQQFDRESRIQEFAKKCDISNEPKEDIEQGDAEPYIVNVLELDSKKLFNYNTCLKIQNDLIEIIKDFNILKELTERDMFSELVKSKKCIFPLKDFEKFKSFKKHVKNQKISHGVILSVQQEGTFKVNHAILNIKLFSSKNQLAVIKIKVYSDMGTLKYELIF